MSEFFAMGGYAAFIWPAYALTVVILAGMAVHAVRTLRQRERQLARLEQARALRQGRHDGREDAS